MKPEPVEQVALTIVSEAVQVRAQMLRMRMCVCGHSAHWHAHDGRGDCGHDPVCQCRAFCLLSMLSSLSDDAA